MAFISALFSDTLAVGCMMKNTMNRAVRGDVLPTIKDFLQQYTQWLSSRYILMLCICGYIDILVHITSAFFKAISHLLKFCCFGFTSAVQYMKWVPLC